jgi:hypothetical protein
MSAYDVLSLLRVCIELVVFSPVLLWVLYVVVMWIKKRHMSYNYKAWEYIYAGPLVVTFYLVDVFVNYTFMSLVLWEFPKSWKEEKTVTERLDRYHFEDNGWRTQITAWVGPLLLDSWDPRGKHVGYTEPEEE